MLLWLLHRYGHLLEHLEPADVATETRVFITSRTALASFTAFLLAVIFGPAAIRWLKGRFRERIASDSARLNELHKAKERTPTMGGLLIMGAMFTAVLLWGNLSNRYVQLAMLLSVGMGAIGTLDDWIKLSTDRKGLTVRQKFMGQLVVSLVVSAILYLEHRTRPHGLELLWPYGAFGISLGPLFVGWSMLLLVYSSNAVNLTDGLDGLAAGCMVFAGAAFVALSYLGGHKQLAGYLGTPYMPGCGELTVVLGAMVGAVLGFLWFNCHPAEVFMGDAGSLPLGGLIGLAALVTRQEILLAIVGGIFLIETLSVVLQVAWYRRTKTRILLCSPLHNHFLFQGMHETKIVTRFWITAALLAIAAIASLKLRTG